MRPCYTSVALSLSLLLLFPPLASAKESASLPTCPCLDRLKTLDNLTFNTLNPPMPGFGTPEQVDCLLARGVDKLRAPTEVYCYPTDYGRARCLSWDERLPPECAMQPSLRQAQKEERFGLPEMCKGWAKAREREECQELLVPLTVALPWCTETWCYVDPENCDQPNAESYYFPGRGLYYSYRTCGAADYFNIWGQVQLEMCQMFAVVEKPYPIMWLSCWACAFMQQLIDATRNLEEFQDRLSSGQRIYMILQLFILITETAANFQRISWGSGTFWQNYNLYVYVFINSSVFIRATMMSQVVWDWYEAGLLKYPTLPMNADNKGWNDENRAALLVMIFQFASSLGVFGIISITHLFPALIVYHWIFLAVVAGLVKSRTWISALGLDPESRSGRALVMGTNSFMSCMGLQVLVTAMVRVYAGEWDGGYLMPLRNDFLARRIEVWYSCHLGNGISKDMFQDQDFINLFIR